MLLREIFVAENDWVAVERNALHIGELHDQYCWLNVIWLIISRRM